MRATDELRKLLDERGVEWKARPDGVTEWVNDGMTCKAVDRTTVGIEHLTMLIPVLTPDQAIAATLGHSLNNPSMSETLSERGTCRLPETRIDHGSIEYNGTTSWRLCSACGAEVLADPANYCPNCGRKEKG